jgi:hypothetical protein
MSRFLPWLLLLFLFGGFFSVAWHVLQARAEAGKGMPPYSVYAEDRNGLGETARLLRKLGWEPIAVTRPADQTRHRGLLILVEPNEAFLTEKTARGLLRWVERGNVLLVCSRRATPLHLELGVSVASDPPAARDGVLVEAAVDEAGGYTDGVGRLVVEGRDTVSAAAGLPLWWVGEQPGAVVLRRGAGRVLLVGDPSLLTLRGLHRQDNVMFLYNLARMHARDGRVYFDEYHHGLRSGGGFWAYLHYHDLQWTLAVLLLVVAVAAWSLMVRLGPPVAAPPTRRADAVEYASAVARIYQLAGVRQLLAKGTAREFLAGVARQLRLRRRALPAELLAAWRAQHPGQSSRQLEELLRGAGELRQADVPERRLLAWVRAFDRFLAEQTSRLAAKREQG